MFSMNLNIAITKHNLKSKVSCNMLRVDIMFLNSFSSQEQSYIQRIKGPLSCQKAHAL